MSRDWNDEEAESFGNLEDPDALPERRVPSYFRWVAILLAFSLIAYFGNLFFRLIL